MDEVNTNIAPNSRPSRLLGGDRVESCKWSLKVARNRIITLVPNRG